MRFKIMSGIVAHRAHWFTCGQTPRRRPRPLSLECRLEMPCKKTVCQSDIGPAEEAESADTGELSGNRPLGAESKTGARRGSGTSATVQGERNLGRSKSSEEQAAVSKRGECCFDRCPH